jgi:hypothetical protein
MSSLIKHLNTNQEWNWVVVRREVEPTPAPHAPAYQLVHVNTFNQCFFCGSMALWCRSGSGSGSADPCL